MRNGQTETSDCSKSYVRETCGAADSCPVYFEPMVDTSEDRNKNKKEWEDRLLSIAYFLQLKKVCVCMWRDIKYCMTPSRST
jgi:hypothetical protein